MGQCGGVDPIRSTDYSRYRGATTMTPNRLEAEMATGIKIETADEAQRAAWKLCRELKLDLGGATRLTLEMVASGKVNSCRLDAGLAEPAAAFQAFQKLYRTAARDLLLTQEPGLLQGPALLGGVYSAPMAMVRFLELTLKVPPGKLTRLDRVGEVQMTAGPQAPWLRAELGERTLPLHGGRTELVVELGPGQDPAEWYAVVAVPSTVAVQQTEDVLSDYKGQLIYGQQATGAAKMQLLAVPFRGQRRLSLWLEAVVPGQSVGYVVARHVQRPDESAVVQLPEVRVVPGK